MLSMKAKSKSVIVTAAADRALYGSALHHGCRGAVMNPGNATSMRQQVVVNQRLNSTVL